MNEIKPENDPTDAIQQPTKKPHESLGEHLKHAVEVVEHVGVDVLIIGAEATDKN